MDGLRVLGADACRAGWIGIALSDAGLSAYFAADIEDLVDAAEQDGTLDVVAIDMPIGLPDASRRAADTLARHAAGPRWPSVFITPVRTALRYEDYRLASAENRRAAGEGMSRQAFALRHKIRQVDRWIRGAGLRAVEVHPEVSFVRLARGPVIHPKSTWAGAALRRRLLATAGIALPDDLGAAGQHGGPADVLDATAAAWTARQVCLGLARPAPEPPETFSDGLPAAIWS